VRPRVLVSWSSGKDAAWVLHTLRAAGDAEVAGLLTTVNATFDRVAMHAVRRELLRAQSGAAGLPLREVAIPYPCPDAAYDAAMAGAVRQALADGVTHVAFGDLFLEDIRRYREERLRGTGIAPLFPLWGRDTRALAREMIAGGLRARITCVDPRKLAASFAGRSFDDALLADLPSGIDPCGENGEFHTCVLDGPMFRHPVPARPGETVERDGFVFADLVPDDLACTPRA
jgi:uncharacterized protein (TIGR00290 family)